MLALSEITAYVYDLYKSISLIQVAALDFFLIWICCANTKK